jgi:long-chain acyl-CoA synthetase
MTFLLFQYSNVAINGLHGDVNKNDNLTADEIIRFCLTRLAKYKVPKQVAFLTELPKNTTGKVLRRKLKQ